jgi:hypothetical protein
MDQHMLEASWLAYFEGLGHTKNVHFAFLLDELKSGSMDAPQVNEVYQ